MGILGTSSKFQNCIKSTNNKIPEYTKEYKREYQFIRGINKEFKYFVDNLDKATTGLFENHRVDRIKYFIKRFLRGQEKGKLQDIRNFEIYEDDVDNLIKIENNFYNFNQYIIFCKDCYEDDEPFIDPYPGFKNIYDDFKIFFSKLNIIYEEVNYISDSDSDSDREELDLSYTDSDLEDFCDIVKSLVSNSQSDSDSDIEDFDIVLPDSDDDSDSDNF